MELKIKQDCPSCGASIILNEDDTLIKCNYCDVNNYKIESVAGRFLLPVKIPDDVSPENLIYVPYIRFKGAIYYIQDQEVRHKIVDTTRIGIKNSRLPVSLGLRPQALTLKPFVSSEKGRFVRQEVPTKNVFVDATKTFDLFEDRDKLKKKRIFHRTFIGETLSRIYQPYFYVGDTLYDGVTNREVGSLDSITAHLATTCGNKQSWEPKFISTQCPECGGLLSGERDCTVLHCTNCATMWREENHTFTPVKWQVVHSEKHRSRYLPFWNIEFKTTGSAKLLNFGDYIRFTNQPIIARKILNSQNLEFFIPAFKINPKAFLQLCTQLTLQQNKLPTGKTRRVVNAYPVNLNVKEGIQAIKTVLASTTLSREKVFPLLPETGIQVSGSILTYLPFENLSHDLVQEHTRASVQTAALRYGRSL